MAKWVVEVTGLRQVMDALEETDRKAAVIIHREIRQGAQRIATSASYRVPGRNPVSNWGTWTAFKSGRDLSFDPSAVAAGFKVTRKNYKRRGVSAGLSYDVEQRNPAGAIFELMGGPKSKPSTASGAHLIKTISSRFPGRNPRTLIPAYYDVDAEAMRERIRDDIIAAAKKAGLV